MIRPFGCKKRTSLNLDGTRIMKSGEDLFELYILGPLDIEILNKLSNL